MTAMSMIPLIRVAYFMYKIKRVSRLSLEKTRSFYHIMILIQKIMNVG